MKFCSLKLIPIQNDFKVVISPTSLTPSPTVIKTIDTIWNQAVEQPGSKLFDGKILCATSRANSQTVQCSILPYRFFYAQRQSNVVRDALQIQIVAVSGIILHDQLLYFGRRSLSNTQYPGFIELVPSGSLDPNLLLTNNTVDFPQQLTKELTEELGIDSASVSAVNPICLIFDQEESTWDICCQITLQASTVISADNSSRSKEYQEILSIPIAQAADFIESNAKNTVPTTQLMLQQFLYNLKLSQGQCY